MIFTLTLFFANYELNYFFENQFELLILDIQIKMETTKLYETWKQTTPVMRQDD